MQYDVVEVVVAARPVAGVRALVPRGHVAQEFGRHLDQVYAAARTGAVALDGQNIFIYRGATADQLTVDFCVGVTAPFVAVGAVGAVGAVVPLETPSGTAAMTTHHGDYRALGDANAAILAWCRAQGRVRAGPSWEVYGHWQVDPAQLRTVVYYLLQPGGATARSQESHDCARAMAGERGP
jgi:hypothetical protein